MSPRLILAFIFAGLTACGGGGGGSGGASAPVSNSPTADDFPVDANGVRFHSIHHAIFGPWYGSGCPAFGDCGCDGATNLAEESSCQLSHLAANDIPVTVYLYDGNAWSQRSSVGMDSCTGDDCCSWNLGSGLIDQLASSQVRALLHFWGGCHTPEQYQRAESSLGQTLLGFYLDNGASDAELEQVSLTMQSLLPGDWENVAKTFQRGEPKISDAALIKFANAAYVNDLPYDFGGLAAAVSRMLSKATLVPAPFAEFTGYAGGDPGAPSEEVYHRRLHFGALQPIMAHTPFANADPWAAKYSPALVASYRYWAWLHRELVPYFYSYAYRMFENQSEPVIRPGPNTASFLVGNELYVPVVTSSTVNMDIQLPPGEWVNYWDESQILSGTLLSFPVPVGHEPIFVRAGSLIPLDVERNYTGHGTNESAGSLTVLVYPGGSSSFRYRQSARDPWLTFTSTVSGTRLSVAADSNVPQPVLFRIERWAAEPSSVSASATTVTVNQGGDLHRFGDEPSINASQESGWYYDANAERLIVKLVP